MRTGPTIHIHPAIDIRMTLARNDHCPPPLQYGWHLRRLEDIAGITIHHTLSHSPWATAVNYVRKTGGRPTIPYHFWVCSCGTILICLDLEEACWHDHTGHKNRFVSIGLAGRCHEKRPTDPQLSAAAQLIVQLIRALNLHPEEVRGHNDRSEPNGFPTTCPGWTRVRTGNWKTDLKGKITAALAHPNGGTL